MDLTYFEYTHDPDPADNSVESIMVYLIRDSDGLRIELDRHLTGLFSLSTWIDLMERAGFDAEKRSFHLKTFDIAYDLLVGVLR